MSDGDDPFERLDDADREGDPFERLDPDDAGEGADEPVEGSDDDPDHRVPDDPFADIDRPRSVDAGADAGPEDALPVDGSDSEGPTDPFDDFERREEDPFGSAESVFERVDVGSIDPDEVWGSIDDEDDEPAVPDEDRYAEVSKHAFCERCPHFSEPPDAHCTHETAEIMEYLDMERVRLLDCPVVAERRDLE